MIKFIKLLDQVKRQNSSLRYNSPLLPMGFNSLSSKDNYNFINKKISLLCNQYSWGCAL